MTYTTDAATPNGSVPITDMKEEGEYEFDLNHDYEHTENALVSVRS